MVTRVPFCSAEWGDGSCRQGDLGDFVIVGGDHHFIEASSIEGCLNRELKHRLPEERANVLAGDAFAAAAGENDGYC